jgi:diketogulonate reductase-like aldo/keto reductase
MGDAGVKASGVKVYSAFPLSRYDCIEMRTVALSDGKHVAVLGQGTWRMGESKSARANEVAALRLGIELGMSLIDTAEMYGDGGAEEIVAEAIHGQHQGVFVVTKVYPHNASHAELPKACERSLKRLRVDAIDLYLLHWRERTPPLQETVDAFEKLRAAGKIKRWGVSNFGVDDMEELLSLENGSKCSANQVLYNLQNREIEFDLLPWSQTNKIPTMAYSPVGHSGQLLRNPMLKKIAQSHDASPADVALAWVLRQADVIAIPKASTEAHVRDNATSLKIKLTKKDLTDLDREFPPPKSKKSLPML